MTNYRYLSFKVLLNISDYDMVVRTTTTVS
jgi:hypothetical protein